MTAVASPTIELIDSTPLRDDPDALRARADELGYLFFRGLHEREDVLDVRRRILTVVRDQGWLQDGTDLMDGIADQEAFATVDPALAAYAGTGVPKEVYRQVQFLRPFHALANSASLRSLYRDLLQAEVVRQPSTIARVMIPGPHTSPTPPHQDFIHVQGSVATWTAWYPLGDCTRELGGLAVLVGSHKDGLLTYHQASGAGEFEAYICNSGLQWATTDFAAGDVLTFPSHTVHKSQPNVRAERVRLSCDTRYQAAADPMAETALRVHGRAASWDEVYASWDTDPETDELRYAWQKHDLDLTEWDENLRWQKHKIC